MQDYYIKKPNGRYERVGYNHYDMPDGFYYRERGRTTSIPYWLGPHDGSVVDVHLLTEILKRDSDLSSFLYKLTDPNSEELKQYKENNDFIKGPLTIYNWSCQDLALVVLQWVYRSFRNSDSKIDKKLLKKQIEFLANKLDYNYLSEEEIELAEGIFELLSEKVKEYKPEIPF